MLSDGGRGDEPHVEAHVLPCDSPVAANLRRFGVAHPCRLVDIPQPVAAHR